METIALKNLGPALATPIGSINHFHPILLGHFQEAWKPAIITPGLKSLGISTDQQPIFRLFPKYWETLSTPCSLVSDPIVPLKWLHPSSLDPPASFLKKGRTVGAQGSF